MNKEEKGKVIVVGHHIGIGAQTAILQRIMAEQRLKEDDFVVINPETDSSSSIKKLLGGTKEARQLSEIIEEDKQRGIVITARHDTFLHKKDKVKNPYWKNGKLRKK